MEGLNDDASGSQKVTARKCPAMEKLTARICLHSKPAQSDEMSQSTNRLHSKYGIDYSRPYAMKR